MILDDHFDRIVILTLPGAEARASRALRELHDKQLSDKALIVRGIDGRICTPSDWWTSGPGAWGCMRSHHRIVEDALMDGVKALLVLEDDCVWQSRAAEMAAEFLPLVPADWGQIYLGGQHRTGLYPELVKGSPQVLKPHSVHRTHAYAVSRAAMPQFLKHILYAPDYINTRKTQNYGAHVDHQLEVAHRRRDWPVYTPSWWLAGQGENLSSINGRQQREQWWQLPVDGAHRRMPLVICDRRPTDGEMAKLHFGYTLDKEDLTIDTGVKRCADRRSLIGVMELIAGEALSCQRLPAIPVHADKPQLAEWVREKWHGPVLLLSDNPDLAALSDFAVSGAIRHPWFNPGKEGAMEPTESATAAVATALPKVHQVWIGDQPMIPRLAAYCETVRKAFPGWDYKLWTEADMATLALGSVLPEVVAGGDWPVGMRSDVIRLEILRQHGGVYFDTDFEALAPDLAAFFGPLGKAFVYGDEEPGRPSNAMMAAPAAHPFVDFYLRRIASIIRIPENLWDTVGMTGPGKLAECLNLWVGAWKVDRPVEHASLRVGSLYAGGSIAGVWKEAFYPYHYNSGTWATFDPAAFPDALAAHHWEGGWHRERG